MVKLLWLTSIAGLTSLTFLLAGVEAGVAVDKLADGVEATAAVAGVHDGVLWQRRETTFKMSNSLPDKLGLSLLVNAAGKQRCSS